MVYDNYKGLKWIKTTTAYTINAIHISFDRCFREKNLITSKPNLLAMATDLVFILGQACIMLLVFVIG